MERWRPTALAAGAALDEALDRPVEELHVDRLRTGPAAPHAAVHRGEQEDGEEDPDEQEHQQHAVGGQERRAEQREAPLHHVEQDERLAVQREVGDRGEQRHQRPGDRAPAPEEAPGEEPRVDPAARAVGVECREHPLACLGAGPRAWYAARPALVNWPRRRRGGLALAIHTLRRPGVRRIGADERADVGGQRADLVGLELILPRHHPLVRHALADGAPDLDERAPMDPVVVREVGSDHALPLGPMTGHAANREDLPRTRDDAGVPDEGAQRILGDTAARQRRQLRLALGGRARLVVVLRDDRRPRADLVVEPVPEREDDGRDEDP